MTQRILFLFGVLTLLSPVHLFAQAGSTEVGFRISSVELDDTTEVDDGEEVLIELDEDLGYGVAVSHFWTARVSTEFAVDRLGADIDVSAGDAPELTFGQLELTLYSATALWHFRRDARVSPYAGIGAAYVSGRFDIGNEVEVEEIDLESELTWIATGGVSFQVSDRVSLAGDLRYAPYRPHVAEADEGEEESVEVNPMMISAAIRFRF